MENKSPIDNLIFTELCKALDKTRNTVGKQKLEFLKNLFQTQFFLKNRIHSYSLIRLICPKQDLERKNQNFQKNKLAKLIANSLNLSKENQDRLIFYDNPAFQPNNSPTGDFYAVLEKVIYKFFKLKSNLTIFDINIFIDKLAVSKKEEKIVQVAKLINQSTVDEFIWLCRILLKDNQLGLSHLQILKTYHSKAAEFYNSNVDLRKLCVELADLNSAFNSKVNIFVPVKPMLAGRKSFQQIKSKFRTERFFIETKLDGERVQCHIQDQKVVFYSRRANDVTNIYGQLSQLIRENVKSKSVILDGEMTTVYKKNLKQAPFGHNRSVAVNSDDPDFQLCYTVFDIFYTQNQPTLMEQPLNFRKRVLEREVQQVEGQLEILITEELDEYQQIIDQFEKAIANNQEGIIIKQATSKYTPNDRSFNWVKLKADYIEGFTDTFDLVIVGGYYGQGIQGRIGKNQVSSFLLAVKDKLNVFSAFVKISSGLSDLDLDFINKTIKWGQSIPLNEYTLKITDKFPDVYIQSLENTLVLEVKCGEIIQVENACGFTLRFPRVVKIRNDKSFKDCMTSKDIQEMFEVSKQMLKKINFDEESQNDLIVKKVKQEKQVMFNYKSDLFLGFVFYIANSVYDIQKLENSIQEHHGTIVKNHGKYQTHILASFEDLNTNAIKKHSPQNIINTQWIFDCIYQEKLLDIYPKYMIFSEQNFLESQRLIYDKFGINYTKIIERDEIESELMKINIDNQILDNKELILIKNEIINLIQMEQVKFKNQIFYFQEDDSNKKTLSILIQMNGGQVAQSFNQNVTYIVEDFVNSQEFENTKSLFISSQKIREIIEF